MQHDGERLKQLQEAAERNERLEEQIKIMARQLELQQELASKQVHCALLQALATIGGKGGQFLPHCLWAA